MKFPWANVALLLILTTLTVTGYFGLVNGHENSAWRLWLHGIAAYALIVLFVWKSSIILDAYRRKKRWTRARVMFTVMLVLLLLTVGMGLWWTFDGPVHFAGFSLVSLHIYVAVPVMVMMVYHTWRMRFIFKVKGTLDRRLFLGTAVASLTGGVLWWAVERGKGAAGFIGGQRRFTGSYERGSFTGRFPATSWIFDYPDRIDPTQWQLAVTGAVETPIFLSYDELLALPSEPAEVLLDCTSGWYTTQIWQGVPLRDLLARAGVKETAVSVTVEAISTYQRRFDLEAIGEMLLAYQVAGQPLSHGHGAPVRLVAPQRRGYEWVKWVTAVHVNTTSALLQPPLPLR